MRNISKLPKKICKRLDLVFSDLDDTLTTKGKIPPHAYHSLWKLHRAGLQIVIVTGRPSGWADAILRLMPVQHVIAENGAVTLSYLKSRKKIEREHVFSLEIRRKNKMLMDNISSTILKKMPGLTLAADQVFRETDIAFDICEDTDPLGPQKVKKLRHLLKAAGLKYKVSSIHLNAWIGTYDKKTACRKLLGKIRRQTDIPPLPLFIGDSPNDEPLFAGFDLSVGVANIGNFTNQMKHLPAYITDRDGAAGFTQMAEHILRYRRIHRRNVF